MSIALKGGEYMNAEKFTQKSIEAIREAQECAIRNQNMQIDQQHLLYALLNQEGGLIGQMMKKLRIDAPALAGRRTGYTFPSPWMPPSTRRSSRPST